MSRNEDGIKYTAWKVKRRRGPRRAWWRTRHLPSQERWEQRRSNEQQFGELLAAIATNINLTEYLSARQAGLTQEEIIGLCLDNLEVEPVASAIRAGLSPAEALVTSRLADVDIEGYALVRRTGVGRHEALAMHARGIDLDTYSAVRQYGGSRDQAAEAATTGISGLGYRICREVGIPHGQTVQFQAAGTNLWTAALVHRRSAGRPYDEFDKFIERVAARCSSIDE